MVVAYAEAQGIVEVMDRTNQQAPTSPFAFGCEGGVWSRGRVSPPERSNNTKSTTERSHLNRLLIKYVEARQTLCGRLLDHINGFSVITIQHTSVEASNAIWLVLQFAM